MDWKPSETPKQVVGNASSSETTVVELDSQIKACGDRVRELKAAKVEKVISNNWHVIELWLIWWPFILIVGSNWCCCKRTPYLESCF